MQTVVVDQPNQARLLQTLEPVLRDSTLKSTYPRPATTPDPKRNTAWVLCDTTICPHRHNRQTCTTPKRQPIAFPEQPPTAKRPRPRQLQLGIVVSVQIFWSLSKSFNGQ